MRFIRLLPCCSPAAAVSHEEDVLDSSRPSSHLDQPLELAAPTPQQHQSSDLQHSSGQRKAAAVLKSAADAKHIPDPRQLPAAVAIFTDSATPSTSDPLHEDGTQSLLYSTGDGRVSPEVHTAATTGSSEEPGPEAAQGRLMISGVPTASWAGMGTTAVRPASGVRPPASAAVSPMAPRRTVSWGTTGLTAYPPIFQQQHQQQQMTSARAMYRSVSSEHLALSPATRPPAFYSCTRDSTNSIAAAPSVCTVSTLQGSQLVTPAAGLPMHQTSAAGSALSAAATGLLPDLPTLGAGQEQADSSCSNSAIAAGQATSHHPIGWPTPSLSGGSVGVVPRRESPFATSFAAAAAAIGQQGVGQEMLVSLQPGAIQCIAEPPPLQHHQPQQQQQHGWHLQQLQLVVDTQPGPEAAEAAAASTAVLSANQPSSISTSAAAGALPFAVAAAAAAAMAEATAAAVPQAPPSTGAQAASPNRAATQQAESWVLHPFSSQSNTSMPALSGSASGSLEGAWSTHIPPQASHAATAANLAREAEEQQPVFGVLQQADSAGTQDSEEPHAILRSAHSMPNMATRRSFSSKASSSSSSSKDHPAVVGAAAVARHIRTHSTSSSSHSPGGVQPRHVAFAVPSSELRSSVHIDVSHQQRPSSSSCLPLYPAQSAPALRSPSSSQKQPKGFANVFKFARKGSSSKHHQAAQQQPAPTTSSVLATSGSVSGVAAAYSSYAASAKPPLQHSSSFSSSTVTSQPRSALLRSNSSSSSSSLLLVAHSRSASSTATSSGFSTSASSSSSISSPNELPADTSSNSNSLKCLDSSATAAASRPSSRKHPPHATSSSNSSSAARPPAHDVAECFAQSFLAALASGDTKWASATALAALFDEGAKMVSTDKQLFVGKTAILRRLNQGMEQLVKMAASYQVDGAADSTAAGGSSNRPSATVEITSPEPARRPGYVLVTYTFKWGLRKFIFKDEVIARRGCIVRLRRSRG